MMGAWELAQESEDSLRMLVRAVYTPPADDDVQLRWFR
jgi:hypothetical protein